MKLHVASGLSYDPEFFDDDTLDEMMTETTDMVDDTDSAGGVLMGELMIAAPSDAPLSDAEIKALLEQSWEEIYASEDGQMIRDLPIEDQERLKADFLTPPEPIDEELAATLKPKGEPITFLETEDTFAVLMGERPLLSGPLGASASDKKLKFQIAAGICIADILALVIAAVGVLQVLNNRTIAKVGATISAQHGAKIIKASRAISAAGKTAARLAKAKAMAQVAKAVVGSATKAASTMMVGMGRVEKIAAWTTAVAGLTLAFATGSASLWASVLAMAVTFAVFLADTAVAVKKYNEWKAA